MSKPRCLMPCCAPPPCSVPAHADLERRLKAEKVTSEGLRQKIARVQEEARIDDFDAHFALPECQDELKQVRAKLASAEQRAREVAGEMRARADASLLLCKTNCPQPSTLREWASCLSPEPPAAKMRHWIRYVLGPESTPAYARQETRPGPSWIELVEKERDDA